MSNQNLSQLIKHLRQYILGHILHNKERRLGGLPRCGWILKNNKHLLEACARANNECHVLQQIRNLATKVLRKENQIVIKFT